MRIVILFSTCLVGILLGCAFTAERIDLQYSPQRGVAIIPEASGITVNVQVIDSRADKSKVGSKKSGIGAEGGPIHVTEEVSITIRKAIEHELRSRGFQIAQDAMADVKVEIFRFYNEYKYDVKTNSHFAAAVSDIDMMVIVMAKGSRIIFSRQVTAQGIKPNIQMMSGSNAQAALSTALQNALSSIFQDKSFLSALVSPATTQTVPVSARKGGDGEQRYYSPLGNFSIVIPKSIGSKTQEQRTPDGGRVAFLDDLGNVRAVTFLIVPNEAVTAIDIRKGRDESYRAFVYRYAMPVLFQRVSVRASIVKESYIGMGKERAYFAVVNIPGASSILDIKDEKAERADSVKALQVFENNGFMYILETELNTVLHRMSAESLTVKQLENAQSRLRRIKESMVFL